MEKREFDVIVAGGGTAGVIAGLAAARNGARTLAALAPVGPDGEPAHPFWDYVVLQEMSHAPATTPEAYARSAAALCALARGAGATPVIYATWAYREGSSKLARLGLSYAQMHDLMHDSFVRVAAQNEAILADACDAFYGAADPAALYAPDGVHPSQAGTAVAASVLARAMDSATPWSHAR